MSARPTPQQIAEAAVSGGGDRVAIVAVDSTVNVRWANGTLTTNGAATSVSTSVVAIEPGAAGRSFGTHSGTVLSLAEVAGLVDAARAVALRSEAAEDAADLVDGGASPDWDAPAGSAGSSDLGALTSRLGELFRAGRAAEVEYFGYAELSVATLYVATSVGTRLRSEVPGARFELTAKSGRRSRSAWRGQGGRTLAEIDVDSLEHDLLRQLKWQERSVPLEPGRHPALLTPSAVSDLYVDLVWSASAREAHDGASVFSRPGGGTRVGETLTGAPITISSDPADLALGCTPFVVASGSSSVTSVFDNGIPLARTDWVRDGRLNALLTTRHTAGLTGLSNTPFVDNFRFAHADGTGTLDQVIARTENAILLNSLWYIRVVDPQRMLLTGLTRDGAYQVRDGEVVGAVSNFRFNESPVELLARVRDAGEPERTLPRELGDYFPRTIAPALLVDEFNFSTVSQAS